MGMEGGLWLAEGGLRLGFCPSMVDMLAFRMDGLLLEARERRFYSWIL